MARSGRRPVAYGVFVAALVVLDLLLHAGLGVGRIAPDLIAVAVLLTARRTGAVQVVLLALALGLIDDAMGVGNLGGRSLGLGLAALAGTWTLQLVEGEAPLLIVPYLFLGKWLADAIVAVIRPGTVTRDIWLELITTAPLTAVWTAVAGTAALVVFRLAAGNDA